MQSSPAEPNIAPPSAEPSAADTKTRLELEKLALEVSQLRAPWWRRPSFILAALPTMLATLTVAYGLANGYFQAAATKLENQRHNLEVEVKAFTEQKTKLQVDLEKLRLDLAQEQENAKMNLGAKRMSQMQQHVAEKRAKALEAELTSRGIPVPPSR